ncbi:unnamed protein product, partial [Rotaria sp. Silwood1]
MSTIILQDTLTVDIDIRDIIQNNPRLNNNVLPLILAKFRSIVPNANEVPEADLKKEIQRKVSVGTSTLVQPKRTRQSNCCQARKRIKTVQPAATGSHSTCSDDESLSKYSLRDRSKLIKIQYDYMTYYESSEEDDDEGSPDDVLLSNVKLLEFMKFKDKYNITDEAIRILNQLESIYGSCPTLYHLKKLRATLNKNIPIKKCDQGAYLHINDAAKLLIHSDPSVLDNSDNQKIHIKHNMDGTTIGTSTNFLMSTITCIESGAKQQTAPNVIPL